MHLLVNNRVVWIGKSKILMNVATTIQYDFFLPNKCAHAITQVNVVSGSFQYSSQAQRAL